MHIRASIKPRMLTWARARAGMKPIPECDMFKSDGQLADEAYELQEQRTAYAEPSQSDSRAEATDR